MLSNEQLIMSGDIDSLYERNKKLMYQIANKFQNNNLEFDDCMGCGDLAFVKAIKSFNPKKGKWTTFFGRIMTNEILMVNRKFKNQGYVVSMETAIYVDNEQNAITLKEVMPATKDTTEEVINLITIEEILNLSKKLSPRKCEVLRLYVMGVKQKDIGERLNLSQSYVARLIKKVCLELKVAYEKEN